MDIMNSFHWSIQVTAAIMSGRRSKLILCNPMRFTLFIPSFQLISLVRFHSGHSVGCKPFLSANYFLSLKMARTESICECGCEVNTSEKAKCTFAMNELKRITASQVAVSWTREFTQRIKEDKVSSLINEREQDIRLSERINCKYVRVKVRKEEFVPSQHLIASFLSFSYFQ